MKYNLLIFGMLFVNYSFSQETFKSILSTTNNNSTYGQIRSLEISNVDSADVLWYEDFREGLDGNNSSLNPAWTTSGDDGNTRF